MELAVLLHCSLQPQQLRLRVDSAVPDDQVGPVPLCLPHHVVVLKWWCLSEARVQKQLNEGLREVLRELGTEDSQNAEAEDDPVDGPLDSLSVSCFLNRCRVVVRVLGQAIYSLPADVSIFLDKTLPFEECLVVL